MAAYLAVGDVRAEGVSAAMVADARVTATIAHISRQAEQYTRTWFEARTKTFTFDGNGHDRIALPQPCLSLTSVTLDGTALEKTTDVYLRDSDNGFAPGELARKNGARFASGRDNVVVVGSFGMMDVSGTTPAMFPDLKWALLRWTVLMLPTVADEDSAQERRLLTAGSVSVDGRSVSRGASAAPFSGDPEVDRILVKYIRPRAAIV